MKLKQFLTKSGMSTADFAEKVGVTGKAVSHWLSGERFPRRVHMERISQLSKGAVTPNDFMNKPMRGAK